VFIGAATVLKDTVPLGTALSAPYRA